MLNKLSFFDSEDKQLIKRSLVYVAPYKKKLILAILATVVGLLLGTLQPFVFGKIIDSIVNDHLNRAFKLVGVAFFLMGFGRGFDLLETYFINIISNKMVSDLRKKLYNNILKLPIKFFDQREKGEFISRFESDIGSLADILTARVAEFIVDVFRVIIVGIIVFNINFTMALFLVLTFPVSYFVVNAFGKKIRSESSKVRNLRDKYLSFFQESLMGIKKVKELKLYKIMEDKMFDVQDQYVNDNIKKNMVVAYSNFANSVISAIVFISLLGIGIGKIESGVLTIGGFVAFNNYARRFQNSLRNIMQLNSNIHETLVGMRRIFEMIDNIDYQKEKSGELLDHVSGEIKFENITFSYQEEKALQDLSIKFSPQALNVIVGYNGAGKSTLFKLLLQFYQPDQGSILLDGVNISNLDREFLLQNIACVSQDPFFFNVSIKENLNYANKEATDKEIIKVCKEVNLHKYIDSLPDKYDTTVGEMGDNLSGGQRQRLAIARALIKKPNIFLFDEPMASIDGEVKQDLISVLKRLGKESTVILISHDLEVITRSDKIFLLNEGKTVAQGEHNKLLKDNYVYENLFSKDVVI